MADAVQVLDAEGEELDLKRGYDDDDSKGDFAGEIITEFNEDERMSNGYLISDDPENDFADDFSDSETSFPFAPDFDPDEDF